MTGAPEAARFRYRPGLDGLRAFAVGAVILYHGQVSWAKGGFLGVDIFFVLSGFLITSLLLREHESTGGIALASFWTRRIRRLLPALFLLLAAVALYAVVWAQPTELSTIRGDGLASLFYVSNWKFIASGASYFQAFQRPSPLTHTWSLAIEEQWYLFWPLAILVMMRIFRGRIERVAGAIVGLACCSALAMAIMFQPGTDPSRVYYGTDTRAQALLVGAALAALTSTLRPKIRLDRLRHPWMLQVAGIAGATLLAVMVVRVDSGGTFLYRGGFLLAAIAAALFVAAASVPGPVSRALGIRPLVAIGVISYGLYLWHWPIDVWLDEARTGLTGFALFALRIGVTGVIATASYFFVERPIRRNGLAPLGSWARARVRPVLVAGMAGDHRVAARRLDRGRDVAAEPGRDLQDQRSDEPSPRSEQAPRAVSRRLAAVHARVLRVGRVRRVRRPHICTSRSSVAACSTSPSMSAATAAAARRSGPRRSGSSIPTCRCSWSERGRRSTSRRNGHTYVHGTPEHERVLEGVIGRAIHPLTARHGKVALLEVPCFGANEGDAETNRERNDPASVANVNEALRAVADRLPARVTFVPWADTICPGGTFTPKTDGIVVRPDGVHVGTVAGAHVIADRLAPVLADLARKARAGASSRTVRRRSERRRGVASPRRARATRWECRRAAARGCSTLRRVARRSPRRIGALAGAAPVAHGHRVADLDRERRVEVGHVHTEHAARRDAAVHEDGRAERGRVAQRRQHFVGFDIGGACRAAARCRARGSTCPTARGARGRGSARDRAALRRASPSPRRRATRARRGTRRCSRRTGRASPAPKANASARRATAASRPDRSS